MESSPPSAKVFYNCPSTDAAFALLAFHLFLGNTYTPIEYVPVTPNIDLYKHRGNANSTAFFLDVVPKFEELQHIADNYTTVNFVSCRKRDVSIVHKYYESIHPSSRTHVHNFCNAAKSSCILAWNTFSQGNDEAIKRRYFPMFVHVNNYVTKKRTDANTPLFMAGIDSKSLFSRYDINENPDLIEELCELDVQEVLDAGWEFLDKRNVILSMYLEVHDTKIVKIDNENVVVRKIHISPDHYFVVEELTKSVLNCDDVEALMIYRETSDKNEYRVNLRSASLNCGKFAQQFGGNGSSDQAVFTISQDEFKKLFD